MSFSIITDTSANLPTGRLKADGVTVIPFSYYVGDTEHTCMDTDVFDGAAYYTSIRRGVKVTTSQVTPQRYLDCMKPMLENGEDLLFVGMSSGISGSFRCAELASEQLREQYPEREIRLIDTLAASLGEGILVLRAVLCRDAGMSLTETADLLSEERKRVCQIFTVDDLMHLRRGGRLSSMSAVVGTVLQIKPILKGNEAGMIVTCGKTRGKKRAVEALAERYDALVEQAGEQTVGIAHADCPEDAAYLETLLQRNHPPREILTVCYEPVTGSHVGPGALALFFEGGADVRSK